MRKKRSKFKWTLTALTLVALVMVILPMAGTAGWADTLNVVPFETQAFETGATAEWTNADSHTGSYSALLTAANPNQAAVGVPVNIPLANINQLSFWYRHKTCNPATGHVLGPDMDLILYDSANNNYYLAGRGGAVASVGDWLEADPIEGTNFATTSTWFWGSCNADLSNYKHIGAGSFIELQNVLPDTTVVYVGVMLDPPGDGGKGSVYVNDITVNNVTYYGKIQDAIDAAASSGDTINVAAGTYRESKGGWRDFEIFKKGINLVGAGSGQTVVQLTGLQHGLEIQGIDANVLIEGITFTRTPGNTIRQNGLL